jgi:hypothetical protein
MLRKMESRIDKRILYLEQMKRESRSTTEHENYDRGDENQSPNLPFALGCSIHEL